LTTTNGPAAAATQPGIPFPHLLLALLVVAVWGTNFVVIEAGLASFPPVLFAALRFALTVVPAIFFVPMPRVRWSVLALYGLLFGPGQFGLLFLALNGSIAPGLGSLVIQTQVFFTIGISMLVHKERIQCVQVVALGLCVAGIATIAIHSGEQASARGLCLILLAALSWAGANVIGARVQTQNMLGFIVWACLFATPPLFAMSLGMEGWRAATHAVAHASASAWASLAWQSAGNSLFGFGCWTWLLRRHPSGTITPIALLIPVFGMGAAALVLSEPMPAWKLGAAACVLSGLAVNLLWARRLGRRVPDARSGGT
jgi:O-acetylserine/cysteine efflux transporter